MSTGDATLELARAKIADLVELFRSNETAYKNPAYNETQTRREFIDPFFKALGWDIDNEAGYAPAYKEVIHEDAIKVGGMTKAPDYCFRIGGQRKFFVEAKKPSLDMKNDSDPYYQLRRYAYSAKLPLSIVTDFEELAIVDCRAKPLPKDKASTGRIRYWHYEEYVDHLEELLETFSPEGIKKGGLDKMATTARSKRGTGEVDKEFLREIEAWRELLARNIALRNPGLSQRELNEAVQVTIDRIIFLRICEDRGIEEYGLLHGMQNGVNVYARLCELFQKADERYNSGLFHFKEERDNPSHPDELTLGLAIDDKPLKQILKGLYYPDSPYEFSVLPIDILGQVYEQFLGKVIRLTAGHRAIVEDKPEVKKAGGVYYTPTYIVDYIVQNTVGKLLEGSTPTKAAKLRILDPACGSGSFLIGAYEYLMDWHRDWYSENDAEKWAKGKEPRLFAGKNGWQLTTVEKKRILLNNIHGVDIDPQAVEVTKLSLLLKVLEEESQETINAQLKFFHERALPDLGDNIKCGNSLIGTDFYEGQQMGLLDEEEALRINAFDWDGPDGFPEIFSGNNPGFDVVIGNPPWGAFFNEQDKPYLRDHYFLNSGKYESYIFFVEKVSSLLGTTGIWGFIIPSYWISRSQTAALRSHLFGNLWPTDLIIFPENVFAGVKMDSCIIVGSRKRVSKICIAEIKRDELFDVSFTRGLSEKCRHVDSEVWQQHPNLRFNPRIASKEINVIEKAEKGSINLGKIVDITQGLTLYRRSSLAEKYGRSRAEEIVTGRLFHSDHKKDETFKKELLGRDVARYKVHWNKKSWISYGPWLAHAVDERFFKGPRLVIQKLRNPMLSQRLVVGFLDDNDTYSAGVLLNAILKSNQKYNLYYLMGLLNSKFLNFWYWKCILNVSIRVVDLSNVPISVINFSEPTDKSHHDQMVELVERMLDLNKRLQEAKTAHEKDSLQRQIDATDRQIDSLVYELYDLTDEEIKIVEETG
jgi:predicted type IV restriction endonuclease